MKLKTLLFQLKNQGNKISYDSDISLDCKFGKQNQIKKASIHNSILGDNCVINEASVFGSTLHHAVTLHADALLYSDQLASHVFIGPKTVLSNCSMGRYSYLAGNNRIFYTTIGAFCSIAENACIGHAEHPYNRFSTSPVFYKKDNAFAETEFLTEEFDEFKTTIIGHDVWIGYNAYVKSGVTIGNGSIIGAGAVVTKDVAPYTIVGGAPAKPIKMRFDDDTIKQVQSSEWWNLDDDDLKKYSQEFLTSHPTL